MRERIGGTLFVLGAIGAAVVFLAPDSLWEYLDPQPGGRVPLMLLLYSMVMILLGMLIGLSRHATQLL